ncbi:MAG: type II toxin-antitoxin system MqsR family toxin [Deltaproteobacteria bacterium]|nr:type II toxin-antitoxin system MqsR family toxin [Deltaproteobacteria bacterium]
MAKAKHRVTDKWKPHYSLAELKKLIANEKTGEITRTSIRNAHALGISYTEIIEIVLSITSDDFYKSMPTYENNKIWQDVYKPRHDDVSLYIKLQVKLDGKGVVIQFKKDEDERW